MSHSILARLGVLLAALAIVTTVLAVTTAPVGALSTSVVVSQVYGGGGNSGAPYRNDFVELFNRGTTTVSLTGWSVQYASATGTGLFSANVTPLSGSLAAGQYYLVQLASGGGNGALLPTPDTTGTTAMGATAGKVVLVNSTTGLACNGGSTPCTPSQLAMIVDLVGWGNADFFEGHVGPPTSNTTADLRNNVGYAETDDNRNDFTAGGPSPRNTASPLRTPPAITTQPLDQTVNDGQAATFAAAASGSPAPTVQWQVSSDGGGTWTNVPGATSATLTFTASASQTGYRYRAVFTNAAGTATTNAAILTVNTPPAITTQPLDQTVNDGQAATFAAAASGSPAPTVQWQVSSDGGGTWTNVPGATSATLTFTASASQTGYRYRAVFTNAAGTATTNAAILTVNTPPAITTQPLDQTVNDGQAATFAAAASGSPAPTVQWQVSSDGGGTWTNVPGATSATLTFTASASQTGYRYRAVFTNAAGTATTNAAILTVNLPVVVISQIYGGGGNTGATLKNDYIELFNRGTTTVSLAGWSVQYASTTGITWYKTDLSGSIAPHGYYLIREAQGAGGTVDLPTPDAVGTITMHQSVGKVVLVASQTLIPTGTSCPAGAAIADKVGYGAGTNCFEGAGPTGSLSNTTAALRRGAGCIDTDSNTADFRVGAPTPRNASSPANPCAAPTVTTQPLDQTVADGSVAAFTASASGTPDLAMRWQVSSDGGSTWTDIPGATSTTLSFTAAATQSGNRYRAVFTNDLGTATSNAAILMVNSPPAITTQPADQTVNDGQAATFAAAASGSPAPTVRWQVSSDGGSTWTDIPGATSTTLSFTAAATQSGNRYRAVFTNDLGTATSAAATLTVRPVTLLPATLPYAVLGEPYRQTLAAENGTPPYAFTLAGGAMPPGVKLSSDGVLSGTPTKVGTYVFSVAVTDASGRSASRSYTLLVRYRFVGLPLGVWDTTSFTDAWAGATLGMLFSLGGYEGADIFADGMPASQRVSCSTLAPLEPLKPLPKRALGLLYSPTGKTYSYLWMTDYSWAGTCRAFVMTLKDGTTHTVYVRFKVSPFPWGHAPGVPIRQDD